MWIELRLNRLNHAQIDDIKQRVNNRLRDLFILDFVKFVVEFKQAQADISKLKKKPPLGSFDLALVVCDKKVGLVDLIDRLLKDKGKKIDKSRDTRSKRKKWR